MSSTIPAAPPGSVDAPITVKVAIDGTNRRFKLPVTDLSSAVFPTKMKELLQIPSNQTLLLERFSDSSASFLVLDIGNPSSYKQLIRAAKAKGKLRLRASTIDLLKPLQPKAEIKQEIKPEVEVKPEEPPRYSAVPTIAELLNHTPEETLPSRPKAEVKPAQAARAPTSKYFDELAGTSRESAKVNPMEALKQLVNSVPAQSRSCWQVCCNNCDASMSDVHYHCSSCDGGDYDLCEDCVKKGTICKGSGHWLIKRFIKNGNVINSTTERIAPRPKCPPPQSAYFKNASTGTVTSSTGMDAASGPTRTCNACVRVLPDRLLVHCSSCPDFDLCMSCHVDNKHGHHPEHEFKPLSKETPMTASATSLCQPGRNVRHWAICDSCDKSIYGIRHKCLECPDFDFCNDCVSKGRINHAHRFVKCYEPLAARNESKPRHYGVYCDGPLCNTGTKQGYIQGVRYKCAICHDTDFCERCEAQPGNQHNQSHPLIKFKTMIQGVKITTMDTAANGSTTTLGDKTATQSSATASSETLPCYTPASVNKGIDHVQATRVLAAAKARLMQVAADTKVAENAPVAAKPAHESSAVPTPVKEETSPSVELQAHFKADTVADGTRFDAQQVFTQTWNLYNPGPRAWPAGCSVRHIGGDYMLNINSSKPSSVHELAVAQETNVTQEVVLPNSTVSFAVTLKAPLRPGKHISYWRLKAPDGTPFGHKLWCDIQVNGPNTDRSLADYQMQLMLLEQQKKALKERETKALKDRLDYGMRQAKIAMAAADPAGEKRARYQKMRDEQQTLYEHFTRLAPQEQQNVAEKATFNHKESGATDKGMPDQTVTQKDEVEEIKMTESAMVFPKLDKESPAASTHESVPAATVSPSVPASEIGTAHTTDEVTDKEDKDADSVAFSDSEDDGFFTDEEYDILDASDEEVINNGAPAS